MTNDTTPATDEQIVTIKNKLVANSADPARKLVMFAVDTDTLESLIARIEALQAEITALKTALDELLDWVNGERRTSDDRLAEIESMLPSKGEL